MKRARRGRWTVVILISSVLGACAGEPSEPSSPEPPPTDHLALAQAAVASPDRPEADRADDERRRPAEIVAFFGIEPGMTVLDLLCGTGYYAEITARVVGDDGRVLCHNNQPYLSFMGESYEERYRGGRLANFERLDAEVADLDLESGSLDVVFFALGFHDLYFRPSDGSWPEMDAAALLAELYDALKPGGVLGIIDHAALPGGDTVGVATDLHRIDEAKVRADVEAAGFVFDAASDVLRHPEDTREVNVFDASIRRQTDRFVLRYRKPGAG